MKCSHLAPRSSGPPSPPGGAGPGKSFRVPTFGPGAALGFRKVSKAAVDAGCVAFEALHRSPTLEIDHWRCLRDDEQLRQERYRDELVLTFVQGGAYRLSSVGRSGLVDPTCATLLWPRSPYSTTHPLGCTDHGCSLAFQSSAVDALLAVKAPKTREALKDGRALPATMVASSPESRLRQLLVWKLCQRRQEIHGLAVEELAFELLEEALQGLAEEDRIVEPVRRDTSKAHHRCVERARRELNRRFREPLRLEELARSAHASPFHLCRLFKAATGMTIRRYLTRLRLAAGLMDLVDGKDSLSRIAVDLGFFSHSHFTATFSREFGLPPNRIRSFVRGDDQGVMKRVLGLLEAR